MKKEEGTGKPKDAGRAATPLLSPLKIGVTGGIGAGKSLVCQVFAALGVAVYDADSRAKQLMVEDKTLVGQIKSQFGEGSYSAEGKLERVFLANEVFSDPEKLRLLNSFVHPRVALDFDRWCQEQKEAPYVIKEAALIFEAGSDKGLDAVIAVSAPEELRLRRTIIRDEHRSRQQVEDIIRKQLPEEERLKRASHRILNDERSLVIPQVLKLHKAFTKGEAGR